MGRLPRDSRPTFLPGLPNLKFRSL